MLRSLLCGLVLLAADPSRAADELPETIRVRLLEDKSPVAVDVEAASAVALYAGLDPLPLVTLSAGQVVRVRAEPERLRVEAPGMTFYTPALRLGGTGRPDEPARFTLRLEGATPLARQYEGTLRVDGEGTALRLIHTVDLETYVAAVVTHEYGLDDDEGTQAMAILARTYALYSRGQLSPDYDVVDHVGSQVFFGLEGVTARARAAAEATRGQTLTWQGQLIRAVYSSSNGGYSANNHEVWSGNPVPYLQAHPDPYDHVSPHSAWHTELDRDDVLRVLSNAFGRGVTGFVVEAHSDEGRVTEVKLTRDRARDETISGQQFRMALSDHFGVRSIRSTLFDVRRDGNRYVFDGKGFGHGVGLSQWGAHGQALEGRTAEQILAFYYPGTRIESAATAAPAADPVLVVDAGVPEAGAPGTAMSEDDAREAEVLAPMSTPVLAEPIADGTAPESSDPPSTMPRRFDPQPEPALTAETATARPGGWTGPRVVRATTQPRRGW